jgi:NADH dehydrogenase/NADH:ubiquinone oxidoreductase subunit G
MSEILLQIDGKEVEAKEGMTILEAARSVGISIPTLCHHEKLEPYGACRICVVEIESRGRTNLVASCIHMVEKNLVVTTRSEKVDITRKILLDWSNSWLMLRIPRSCRNWLKSMAQTKTVLKKSPHSAFFVVSV